MVIIRGGEGRPHRGRDDLLLIKNAADHQIHQKHEPKHRPASDDGGQDPPGVLGEEPGRGEGVHVVTSHHGPDYSEAAQSEERKQHHDIVNHDSIGAYKNKSQEISKEEQSDSQGLARDVVKTRAKSDDDGQF